MLLTYSINLNQWIITNINVKYATGKQWMWEPSKSLLCDLTNLVLDNFKFKEYDIGKLKLTDIADISILVI